MMTKQRGELSSPAALVIAGLAALIGSLDTALNIAFPDLTTDFDLDVTAVQWMVVSYVLTYACLLLPIGRIADRWGHRLVLVVGLVVSTLAFALSVSSDRRGRALGAYQMSAAVGLALGPLIGGVLVRAIGWRGVFWFRVPLSLVLLLAIVAVPFSRNRDAIDDRPLDLPGAGLLIVGTAALLFVVSIGRSVGWGSHRVLIGAALGIVAVVAFLKVELRSSSPLIDLKLFRNPGFGLANVLNVLSSATMFAVWLLVPFYLVEVLGFGAIASGAILTVTPACTAAVAPLAGRLADRLGTASVSSAGLGVEAVGLAVASRLGAQTSGS